MSLEIVALRQIAVKWKDAVSVSMTADLKLMSVLTKHGTLEIFHIEADYNNALKISDVLSYSWQEDVFNQGPYKIMCINSGYDVVCFDICLNNSVLSISLDCPSKWNTKTIFQNFLSSLKGIKDLNAKEILRYQSKECVIVYNGRFLVTLLLSNSDEPRVISFADVCEDCYPARKFSIVKDTVFVLSHNGATLSAYSMINNSKLLDLDVNNSKFVLEEIGAIEDFVVSLESDVIVLYSERSCMYYMYLDDTKIFSLQKSSWSGSAVTAFTKQLPSIQPVSDGMRRSTLSTVSGHMHSIFISKAVEQMNLEHMAFYNGKLCFLFTDDVHTVVGIHVLGPEAVTFEKKLRGHGFIVTGNSETFPLLLFHDDKLSLLLYDIEHNKLVDELMIYQCSKTAESLSYLNHWQNICINVEVLKQGLRNRQLDSIKFFLKTHQECFAELLSSKSVKLSLSELKRQLALWHEIMDLLLTTISATISDYQAHSFVKELLKIATAFAIQLLEDVCNSKSSSDCAETITEKQLASVYFSSCLKKLRNLLSGSSTNDASDNENVEMPCDQFVIYDRATLDQWNEWENVIEWQEIVKESLLNGNIALAQSYFLNHEDEAKRKYGSLQNFHKIGFQLANTFLKERKSVEAVDILSNLGVSVNEKLHDILKNTCERDTRRNLQKELMSRDLLTEEDQTLLQYASIVEQLFPCSSFEHAKQLQEEKSIDAEEQYNCSIEEREIPELIVGDYVKQSWNNCETGDYCCIKLDWLSQWDNNVKERVLVPQFLKGSLTTEIEISPMSVWSYLLEHGESMLIMKWIAQWLGKEPWSTPTEFPFRWDITIDMIDVISEKAPVHLFELALNELARYGVFSSKEQNSIPLLFSRLEKSLLCLDDPKVFFSGRSSISFGIFFHNFIHFCLDQALISLMFKLCIKYHNRLESWPSCHECETPEVKMLQTFCTWSRNVRDKNLAFEAMMSTAEKVFGTPDMTIKSLLLEVPPPLNIAILLFSAEKLSEVVKSAQLEEQDTARLKNSFQSYPVFCDTLLQGNEGEQFPEMTIYQLLQENSVFDISKLFGWHSMHSLKSDEALTEIPHFLTSKLSDRYGLKEQLNHFYYLIEGRPNYAYLKFIAQEIVSGHQISYSRIRLCCKQVLNFALANFRDQKICSACLVFLEMLGQGSLPLRTCLVNANALFEDQYIKCSSEESKSKIMQEISSLFQKALEDKEVAGQVIGFLEAEVIQKMHFSDSERFIFEDIALWMPVVTLANFYDVPVGDPYLQECAKEDDWLRFLVFSQVFQLKTDQMMKSLSKFSNCCIGNHLSKALEKKQPMDGDLTYQSVRVPTQKKRDLRKSLYSRIGLIKDGPIAQDNLELIKGSGVAESDDETVSLCSLDTTVSSDPETGSVVVMTDLFQQLLHAHSTDIPWVTLLQSSLVLRNPVLSVLAASYQESDILCCLTIWLMTALPQKKPTNKNLTDSAFAILTTWTEEELEKLFVQCIREKKILLLWQGISIFLSDSILCALLEYLLSFLVYKNFESSAKKLQEFQIQFNEHKDEENSLLTLEWIEKISCSILREAVITCQNSYERLKFLLQLSSQKIFRTNAVDFSKLYHMIQCLEGIKDCDIESLMLPPTSENYQNCCWRTVKALLQRHQYKEAKKFALTAGLPLDEVFLLQLSHESEDIQKTPNWNNFTYRMSFWKRTILAMKQNNLKFECIVNFLCNKCDSTEHYGDKCYLMQLLIANHKQKSNAEEIAVLTRDMWYWFIKEVESSQLSDEEFNALLPSNSVCLVHDMAQTRNDSPLSDAKEIQALEIILNTLLTKKELSLAFEVANIFNHDSNDLKIIRLCSNMAKGVINPNNVDISDIVESCQQTSVTSPRKKSVVTWTLAFENDATSHHMDNIKAMQNLSEKSEVCKPICERILVNYSVAMILDRSYDDISMECDPFVVLKSLLSSHSKEKFALARSLITVNELSDESVAVFLCSEIHSCIVTVMETAILLPENRAASIEEDIIYNPSSADEMFNLTVRLCQDPSLLGKKLMNLVALKCNDYEIAPTNKSLILMVELCICAHNCFTVACHVDGISQVLQKSKKLVDFLTEANKFSLMVNLLTGIGRYGEMNYVFDKLHEHNQIEGQLLKRRMHKVPHLKLALIDYLKRCPSSDNYYSALVHSFNMEREIAQDREMAARKNLALFCKENSDPDLKKKLKDVMKDLVAAAENYCQADCLLQAQLCAELMNLVALQVYLFDSGTWIIGLDENAVSRYIKECAQFSEALIIAEAYRHHHSWNQAVSHNVIVKGNRNYFRDMQAHMGISESLIEDVAKSFNMMPNKTEMHLRNMKWILSHCQNLEVKYELAKQMKFDDVVEEMNMGENAAFLQDLMSMSSRIHK